MPPTRKRAGDLTGIETERLQKAHEEELADRASQITMIQAASASDRLKPVDLSGPSEEVVNGATLKRPKKRVRALASVNATVGRDNHYDLTEGRTYDLPAHVADHLMEKGLVWA